MSPAVEIPEIEATLRTWLLAQPTVAALDIPIVPRTPADTGAAWIKLRQLEATTDARSGVEHLIQYLVQLDCYAGEHTNGDDAQDEASTAARVLRAAFGDIDQGGGLIGDGIVVTAYRVTGHTHRPDGDFEPERERYILSVNVWAHAR